MKTALVVLAMIAGFALPTHAAGINLSWDDCGTAGSANKTFACDSNEGANFVLVGSFVPPPGTTAVTGIQAILDIGSQNSPLPDWWRFKNAGACRQTALTASADFGEFGSDSCADYWAGQAVSSFSYTTPFATFDCRARLILAVSLPIANAAPVDANLEYYAFRLDISRAKTVGVGSCAHCAAPAILVFNEMKLSQPGGVGDYRLATPVDRNIVEWQSGYTDCGWVPTRNSTWGAIKAQYR